VLVTLSEWEDADLRALLQELKAAQLVPGDLSFPRFLLRLATARAEEIRVAMAERDGSRLMLLLK